MAKESDLEDKPHPERSFTHTHIHAKVSGRF